MFDVIKLLSDGANKSALDLLEGVYKEIGSRVTKAERRAEPSVRFSLLSEDSGPKSTVCQ